MGIVCQTIPGYFALVLKAEIYYGYLYSHGKSRVVIFPFYNEAGVDNLITKELFESLKGTVEKRFVFQPVETNEADEANYG